MERPFVDRGPGDPAAVAAAVDVAARRWGLPAPQPMRFGMNALFVADDVVLRVSRPTAPAAVAIELHAVLRAADVAVPVPAFPEAIVEGEQAVTAWERLRPVGGDADWRAVGEMVARIHAIDPADLPAAYPQPPCESFPWWRFDELLAEVAPAVDAPARTGIEAVIDRHRGWSERIGSRAVCHGDVHPGNVMMTADGPVLLDWDLLCRGPAAWDHAMLLRIARWGWPAEWYEEFAAGYGRSMAGDPLAEEIAELRLVAASLMRLRAGLADPAAMPEAQHRLAYWREPASAPTWNPH
ncbi:MAG: aminoglycoside phosphotransferase family protein [Ilumatobacteraceae bacterium]